MNKIKPIKPFERIAKLFQISNESAKYLLNHVQKSFKVEKPSHQLILDFVETQYYEFVPTAYDIASAMKETKVWDYEIKSPPAKLEDEEDIYQ